MYCIHNAFKNCIIFLVLHCIKGNNLTTISADRLVAACSHGTFLLLAFRVPSGFTFKQRHILIQLLDICRSTPHGEYLMGISCQNTGGFFFSCCQKHVSNAVVLLVQQQVMMIFYCGFCNRRVGDLVTMAKMSIYTLWKSRMF